MGVLSLEVAWRLHGRQLRGAPREGGEWWLRGGGGVAQTSAVDEGHGTAFELRAGVEHRPDDCGRGCLYYGVDLAFVRGEMTDAPDDWQLTGVVAIPRGGLDLGGDRVRFRLGVEMALGAGSVHDHEPDLTMPIDTTQTRFAGGFAVTTALLLVLD
jgi:hypothetical protein